MLQRGTRLLQGKTELAKRQGTDPTLEKAVLDLASEGADDDYVADKEALIVFSYVESPARPTAPRSLVPKNMTLVHSRVDTDVANSSTFADRRSSPICVTMLFRAGRGLKASN